VYSGIYYIKMTISYKVMANVKVQLASWTKHKTIMNWGAILWSMNLAFMDVTFYSSMTFISLLSMMMHIVVNYLWNTLPSWMKRKNTCVYKTFPPFVSCFISCSKPFPTFFIFWKSASTCLWHCWNKILHYGMYVYMYLCMYNNIIWSFASLITCTCKCL
jgi:hypothetical protein